MKPYDNATAITLAHGNGGRLMRELIDEVFVKHLDNPDFDCRHDAAQILLDDREIMVTTDGYTVQPLEFPGGDIGSLAVHGTVNDLAVAGAQARYLSLNVFIEEGLSLTLLDQVIGSLALAARQATVAVITGDTKVLPRGEVNGLYLATTGIGIRQCRVALGFDRMQDGDAVLVSGPLGDHGAAVMLAREQFGLSGDLQSDSSSVWPLAQALYGLRGLRFMRDPTRGGIATVCCDIVRNGQFGLRLQENTLPIRPAVQSVCDMLGFDPLYLACEGRVVAIVSADQAEQALALWRALPQGRDAAIIGSLDARATGVVLTTRLGGERVIEELEDEPLPRIC